MMPQACFHKWGVVFMNDGELLIALADPSYVLMHGDEKGSPVKAERP